MQQTWVEAIWQLSMDLPECRQKSIRYHGSLLEVSVNKETCSIEQLEGTAITVELYGKEYVLEAANQKVEVPYQEN